MTLHENRVKYPFVLEGPGQDFMSPIIETTISTINVTDLMARVRAKANELRRIETRPKLPAIGSLTPLSVMVLPKPASPKGEQILRAIGTARAAVTVARWIPKPLRGLFRRQSTFNRDTLRAIETVANVNAQLADRLQHLAACIAVQDHGIQQLAQLRERDGQWMNAVSQVIADTHDKLLESRTEISNEVASKIEETSGSLKALEHDARSLRDDIALLLNYRRELKNELRDTRALITETRAQLEDAIKESRTINETCSALTTGLTQLRGEGQAMIERLAVLEDDLTQLREQLESSKEASTAATAERLGQLEIDIPRDVRGLREALERAGEHLRNLQSQVDREMIQQEKVRELEGTLARLEQRVTDDGSYLKAGLAEHREVIARLQSPGSPGKRRSDSHSKNGLLDSFYVRFEDRFRGTRPEIKRRLKPYLPIIRSSGAGSPQFPVLDVGCGRGEWLELLSEHHLSARGVDSNATMQAQCVERRFDVTHADLLDYMRTLPDGRLGAVTAFHIIEHLPLEALLEFVSQAYRTLRPGGVAIFETPNCKNLLVGACNFYLDPTHRNPIPPDTAEFILTLHGFVNVQIKYLSPIKGSPFRSKAAASQFLNDRLFGPQDFGIVGFKSPSK